MLVNTAFVAAQFASNIFIECGIDLSTAQKYFKARILSFLKRRLSHAATDQYLAIGNLQKHLRAFAMLVMTFIVAMLIIGMSMLMTAKICFLTIFFTNHLAVFDREDFKQRGAAKMAADTCTILGDDRNFLHHRISSNPAACRFSDDQSRQ